MNIRADLVVYAYPVRFVPARDGGWTISCRDLPDVVSQAEADEDRIDIAEGALQAAIEGRVLTGGAIPAPSPARRGEIEVSLPVETAAKAALYSAMQEVGISKSELAKRLNVNEKEARRLLDPKHPSKLTRVSDALAVLGRRMQVSVYTNTGEYRAPAHRKPPVASESASRTAVGSRARMKR